MALNPGLPSGVTSGKSFYLAEPQRHRCVCREPTWVSILGERQGVSKTLLRGWALLGSLVFLSWQYPCEAGLWASGQAVGMGPELSFSAPLLRPPSFLFPLAPPVFPSSSSTVQMSLAHATGPRSPGKAGGAQADFQNFL